jgi:TrmH family RNA methyltransferase
LFGNEAQGLSAEEVSLAAERVAVPLYGRAESLNVATAATVCLYASAMSQHGHRS